MAPQPAPRCRLPLDLPIEWHALQAVLGTYSANGLPGARNETRALNLVAKDGKDTLPTGALMPHLVVIVTVSAK